MYNKASLTQDYSGIRFILKFFESAEIKFIIVKIDKTKGENDRTS